MSAVARLVEPTSVDGSRQVWTWCPGCDRLHPFTIETGEAERPTWQWDGNLARPTFSPSLLVHQAVHLCEGEHDPVPCPDPLTCEQTSHQIGYRHDDGTIQWRFGMGEPYPEDKHEREVRGHGQPCTRDPGWGPCHSFLRDGRWEFLSDSAHHLAGQTVDMVPLPDLWQGE